MYEREEFGYSALHQLNVNRLSTRSNMVVGQTTDYPQPQGISFPVTPDVRLKKLPFYDTLAVLIKPSTLIPVNSQRIQEKTFNFHLNAQQATEIASNRDMRNPQKLEHVIQVQLRFCQLDITTEQEDNFPPNVIVKVNNKPCQLPNPIPTNKPGVEPKRPPRPVNITPHVKLSPTVTNQLQINWCMEFNKTFVVACYLVKKLTSNQLLQRLQMKGLKPAEYTKALIIDKLREDDDIATTLLKVSLMCPLGKMRMSTPCRAATCGHLQCFDASLYLQMNERKPTWNCPVCDKPAIFDNLVIDGYFQDVLTSGTLPLDKNEIQLHNDGSWTAYEKEEEIHTDYKKPSNVAIDDDIAIIDDDDDDVPRNQAPTAPQAARKPVTPPPISAPPRADTVDLTLSDSDDDPQRPASSRQTSNGTVTATNSRPQSATSVGGGKPNGFSHYYGRAA